MLVTPAPRVRGGSGAFCGTGADDEPGTRTRSTSEKDWSEYERGNSRCCWTGRVFNASPE